MLAALLSFTAVATLFTVTPGADTLVVLRTALAAGRHRAILTVLGICTGCAVWGGATVLGVSALLAASRLGFEILRALGALYLLYLGASALLRRPPVGGSASTGVATAQQVATSARRAYQAGLLTNLLNPKVGIFYLTFLPQFVPAGASPLLLTAAFVAIHCLLGLLWLGSVAVLVQRADGLLQRTRLRRRLEQATGMVLIGFAVRLGLSPGP